MTANLCENEVIVVFIIITVKLVNEKNVFLLKAIFYFISMHILLKFLLALTHQLTFSKDFPSSSKGTKKLFISNTVKVLYYGEIILI